MSKNSVINITKSSHRLAFDFNTVLARIFCVFNEVEAHVEGLVKMISCGTEISGGFRVSWKIARVSCALYMLEDEFLQRSSATVLHLHTKIE